MSSIFGKRTLRELSWKEKVTVKEWFEKELVLLKGKTRGLFQTKEVPHLEKVFELASQKHINTIVMRVASQTQKGHPLDTEIPTINGFKKVKDLKINDTLYDENGKPCRLIGKSKIFNKDLYRIYFDDNSYVDCSDDHLWTVYEKKRNGYDKKTITTLEMIKKGIKKCNGAAKFSIPLTKPIYKEKKVLPIDPYVFGLWLGDGSLKSNVITIDKKDLELVDYINNSEINSAKIGTYDKRNNAVYIRLYSKKDFFMKHIRCLGIIDSKFIPEIYLNASIEQRKELLRGILDADGSVRRCGSIVISQSNKELINNISTLLKTLGIKHNINIKSYLPKLNGEVKKRSYKIEFTVYKELIKCFKLKRKLNKQNSLKKAGNRSRQVLYRYIKKIEKIKTVQSQCLSVDSDSNLYLCTKNYIPTHNTTTTIGMLLYWLDTDFHDMFYMIPRAKDIKKFLNFKIKPFIDGCKSVKDKLEEYSIDEKERKNSFFYKTPNNMLAIISANDTKSITTKYGVFDEAAEMPVEVIEEAKERFKDYGDDYKILIVSTQIHEDDAINKAWQWCEVKYMRHLKCPNCNKYFVPQPDDLIIPSEDEYKKEFGIDELSRDDLFSEYVPYASRNAYLKCPNCDYSIYDKEKKQLISNGMAEWLPVRRKELDNNKYIYEIVEDKEYFESVGFDMSSMLAKNVTIKAFAQKELACRLEENPIVQQELYEKFYVGWWNLIYKTDKSSRVNKNDVLLLCNGLEMGVVPDNVSHLVVGVDLQKDRLYYTIIGVEYQKDDIEYQDAMNLHLIQYGELWAGVNNDDLRELENIIEAEYYNKNGEKFSIHSVGIDIRGFSRTDKESRSSLILDFIFKYAYKLRDYGVVDWDRFIHPIEGVEKFSNATFEAQGYKTLKYKREINDETLEIYGIQFSNNKIKALQENLLTRSIQNAKGEANFSNNLISITSEMCKRWEERQKLPPKDRGDKHSLENHLTSEYLSRVSEDGKVLKEPRYIKIYPSARNDYWDCNNICIALIKAYKLHQTEKFSNEEKNEINLNDLLS